MKSKYFDRNGKEITLDIWTRLISDPGYFIIGRNVFSDGTLVSTRWHGSPTRLFVSVVFSHDEILDEETYYKEVDAIEGHKKYLKKYNYV